jgi:hypothetical protein
VTDDHDHTMALRPARVETGAHELGTNALPLVVGHHGHRRETDRRSGGLDTHLHGRKENVTDDSRIDGCDERDGTGDATQRVNEYGLARPVEGAASASRDSSRRIVADVFTSP